MEEIDDCEMECEQISIEHGQEMMDQELVVAKPATPNNISGDCLQSDERRPETPPNNSFAFGVEFAYTPKTSDTSVVRRLSVDSPIKNPPCTYEDKPAMTSTPFMDRYKLSNTLPSSLDAPNFIHLRHRQCQSAGNIRGPKAYKYLNPFTPEGKALCNRKQAQKGFKRLSLDAPPPRFNLNDSSEAEPQTSSIEPQAGSSQPQAGSGDQQADSRGHYEFLCPDLNVHDSIPGKTRLRQFNVTRYHEEFMQLMEIGKGSHGCVFKCINRLNGCLYAIKKTKTPIKTGIQERNVRNEIYAHGVLFHPNIVRNFSCWREDGIVFIQNELCNGGNLENYIESNTMSEPMLRNLLLHIASALSYMHGKGMAHMDTKPGNIFLCIERESSLESDGGYSDDDKVDDIIFKLGDFGHVAKLDDGDAEDGDCRYIAKEIIQEKYAHLDKADVFALGLTVYEAAGAGPLPKNGEEWHEIRSGKLQYFDSCSIEFNNILKSMTDPSPENRPSAADLVKMLNPTPPSPLPEDVATYIEQCRRTNTHLEHTAMATSHYLKHLYKSHRQIQEQLHKEKSATPVKDKLLSMGKKKAAAAKSRIIGRRTKRSSSTTTF